MSAAASASTATDKKNDEKQKCTYTYVDGRECQSGAQQGERCAKHRKSTTAKTATVQPAKDKKDAKDQKDVKEQAKAEVCMYMQHNKTRCGKPATRDDRCASHAGKRGHVLCYGCRKHMSRYMFCAACEKEACNQYRDAQLRQHLTYDEWREHVAGQRELQSGVEPPTKTAPPSACAPKDG